MGSAGLFWNVGSQRQTVWVLVDRSLSAGTRGEARLAAVLRELSQSLHEDDLIGVISFSDTPQLEAEPQSARRFNPDFALSPMKPSEETYLAPALAFARHARHLARRPPRVCDQRRPRHQPQLRRRPSKGGARGGREGVHAGGGFRPAAGGCIGRFCRARGRQRAHATRGRSRGVFHGAPEHQAYADRGPQTGRGQGAERGSKPARPCACSTSRR